MDREKLARYAKTLRELRTELGRTIVGQEEVIDQVLMAILTEGHVLLVGVPGLAKTLLVRSLANLIDLGFKRIQFTPDLMPSDITGATLIRDDRTGARGFHFLRGPIFTQILLADEINRTPPKTQAALMEAMEERQVTASGQRIKLERPFFVLATQNPIEQEGTYPLPVSQLDRFLFKILVDYPTVDDEFEVVLRTTSTYSAPTEPSISREDLLEIIDLVASVELSQEIIEYASELVRLSRPSEEANLEFVTESISWGAGPRAIQAILAAARAHAFMAERSSVNHDDVHAVAFPALRHRLVLTYHAEAEGIHSDTVVAQILESMGRYQRPKPQAEKRKGLLSRFLPNRT